MVLRLFMQCKSLFKIEECAICIELSALAFTESGCFVQRGQNSKIGFHRLEVFEIGMCNIMTQRAEHGGLWKRERLLSFVNAGGVDARQQAGGDVAHVPLHTGDLPREK